jgi:hypothetical protein
MMILYLMSQIENRWDKTGLCSEGQIGFLPMHNYLTNSEIPRGINAAECSSLTVKPIVLDTTARGCTFASHRPIS